MAPSRRFPPPWSSEESDACFIVRDRGGQAVAYLYFEDEAGRALKAASAVSPRLACRAVARGSSYGPPSLRYGAAAFTRCASEGWRPRPELNRGKRFCRPLRNHSATWP